MNTWDELIIELEALLDSVNAALESETWEDFEQEFTTPRPESLPEPTSEQRERAIALLESVAAVETQIKATMDATQSELSQGSTKRRAARHYAGSRQA